MSIRIANAAGFWGDDIDAPRRLVESAQVDYLTLEYLAELTMSILAHLKRKDAQAGFAADVLTVTRDIIPSLKQQPQLRVITNAGGLNPAACARAVSRLLVAEGLGQLRVGVVSGDDLNPRLAELQAAGFEFPHMDTGEPLGVRREAIQCANVYLGAAPIVAALADEARIVITGRVADASLTVAPAMHEFQWSWTDWDRLAAASVAGHLIECGAQVTGGYSDRWRQIELVNIGYPIAELEPDGATCITKPDGSGGVVDRRSVVEQLVYEIGDPRSYYTPDVIADFTRVHVAEMGKNRVRVSGAGGRPAPDTYKVSMAYQAGYGASAELLVWGERVHEKARFVGELIFRRLQQAGYSLEHTNLECLGLGEAVPGVDWFAEERTSASLSPNPSPSSAGLAKGRHTSFPTSGELVLRMTVRDSRREAVERFAREIAPLITNGPSGLAGYASGRPSVRPVLAYWPTLIPKDLAVPNTRVERAAKWCEE